MNIVDSADSSDGITNNPLVNIAGVEDGVAWYYRIGKSTYSGSNSNNFQLRPGENSYEVFQVDSAGNQSASTKFKMQYLQSASLTSIGNIRFSNDSGASSSDLLTNTAAQTISAVLTNAIKSTDRLWGSVDNGASWVNVTDKVDTQNNTLSWDGAVLPYSGIVPGTLESKSSFIKFKFTDVAGNEGADVAGQARYTLDLYPQAPCISYQDTGSSQLDGVTRGRQMTINGIAYQWRYAIDRGDYTNWITASDATITMADGFHSYAIQASDAAGNINTSTLSVNVANNDIGNYRVGDILYTSPDRFLNAGKKARFSLTVSGPVVISGIPQVQFNGYLADGTKKLCVASYIAGLSTSTTLVFESDGFASPYMINSILPDVVLNGASIKTVDGVNSSLSNPIDYLATSGTLGHINIGQSIYSFIDPYLYLDSYNKTQDYDWFEVDLTAGQGYDFNLWGSQDIGTTLNSGFYPLNHSRLDLAAVAAAYGVDLAAADSGRYDSSSALDSFLVLRDALGSELAVSTASSGNDGGAHIGFTASSSGSYYLEVGRINASSSMPLWQYLPVSGGV